MFQQHFKIRLIRVLLIPLKQIILVPYLYDIKLEQISIIKKYIFELLKFLNDFKVSFTNFLYKIP